MISDSSQIFFFLEVLIFASVIFMHLSEKNYSVVFLYALQSFIVTVFLFIAVVENFSWMLFFAALAAFAVKVVMAPYFFRRLILKHQLRFNVNTYLKKPLALVVVAILTALTYSHFFAPLTQLAPQNSNAILLAIAMMLTSLFLIINRQGALSQMVGVLSLENAIVSFAFLAGLEESPSSQLGIMFDIAIWVVIATVFAGMVYKQFGSLNVTAMKHLKEE
ncbi:MAG: hypothetical protein A2458_04510 [Candidatus Kerfeldbacteria bacterium RIFOXYC2_FULL_38_9]|uniref:Uncharacterized protein n=1 Tax=Candidatus Kerfeldbacteria bacterium RIFOXYB2_FULL_38_14 TaxID=1798547 RepID=A0A1G2BIL6_9BACT|nr:MAG: hypothetical protein A2319_02505 [Candidatus Kerfeldbacteria bacterium RIFOXYB2_FULL_38_14]OGY90361.1 MAG: hypothetical protein A2458_04510 [Candidatus Kerfeldbacteria bacterium RIFOXYC2_FULL_38_9]